MSENPASKPPSTESSAQNGVEPLRIDRRLLEILVCPMTKGPLEYHEADGVLISRHAGVAYPIRDGIPIMIPDEAVALPDVGKSD